MSDHKENQRTMRPPLDLQLAAALPALGIEPQWVYAAEPIHGGLSGARLWRLWLVVPAGPWTDAPRWRGVRVIKAQAAGAGWIASATHDTYIREAALWQTGLAARLPRQIGHAVERVTPVIQCPNNLLPSEGESHDLPNVLDCGEVGMSRSAALLMRDVRSRLMRAPYQTPPGHLPESVRKTLDALARLHARFWEAPELDDRRLGLTSLRDTLLWLGPDAIQAAIAAGIGEPYLELARRGWQAFFDCIAPEDSAALRATLAQPQSVLAALGRLPHTLIHGDVWGPNLGRLPHGRTLRGPGAQVLLIDWALTAAAPATWDLLGLFGAWHGLSPDTLFAAYRERLTKRLRARQIALSPPTWRLLRAAAYLRGALTLGEAYGRAVGEARDPISRRKAIARARWWSSRGARAARLLERAT
jgi:hypothetical protein